MNIAEQLHIVVVSLETLATTLNGDGDSTGAQVLDDNANRLDSLIAECAGKVLVTPTTWGGINLVGRYAAVCCPPASVFPSGTTLGCGDTTAEAIAELQAALDRKGESAPIEASQAGGQPPDGVQVPREVYHGVLDSLDYLIKFLPSGPTRDTVVRDHERLKMCAATAERGS